MVCAFALHDRLASGSRCLDKTQVERERSVSTQAELAVTYDVSNDFFRLWLDERMNYSCALFANDHTTLEEAQSNKLAWFHDRLQLSPRSSVIDIGCGWGGNLEFLTIDKGLRDVTGITLSSAQYEEVMRRSLPGVSAHCVSYKDFVPHNPFDAAVSIGMFEHLATPEQARSGENVEVYRNYFRKVRNWTKAGASFGLQTVISTHLPRDSAAAREIHWTTQNIFPGAITPRLETVIQTASPYWEVMEIRTRREHYRRTVTEWLNRLSSHERVVRENWGTQVFSEYHRYLAACAMAFAENYQSLAQLILRRCD
jgi:cyclopropane-fatty-acyl-phospholipid synthase